ncbi:MAG: hypothetical protein C0603_09800 [Denitrovibrio sp.]|nr:MAG: hypothetical protein C0603_09800 [Denitrovibrio sp.]
MKIATTNDLLNKTTDISKANIIFYHIPKTGGNSFNSFLKTNYSKFYKLHDIFKWKEIYKDYQENKKIAPVTVSGHKCWGIHEYLPNLSVYTTLLREPVARYISDFKYKKTRGVINPRTTLRESLDDLCSGNTYLSLLGTGSYEKAIDNLTNKIAIFGFTERYNEFLELFRYHLKFDSLEITNANMNKKASQIEIDDDDVKYLQDLLATDIKFYNYALGLYNERYQAILEETKGCSRVTVISTEKSYTHDSSQILAKGYHSTNSLIYAREAEESQNLEKAEKHYIEHAQYVSNGHLLKFYKRNNLSEKYIKYMYDCLKSIGNYHTETEDSGLNKFILAISINLCNMHISNKDWVALEALTKIEQPWQQRMLDNVRKGIMNSLIEFNNISDDNFIQIIRLLFQNILVDTDNVIIFGSGQAAHIAYLICCAMDISIVAFLDDNSKECSYKGYPIINRSEIDRYIDANTRIVFGPYQNINTPSFFNTYEIIHLGK